MADTWTNLERLQSMSLYEFAQWLALMEEGAVKDGPMGVRRWEKILQMEVPK